MDIKDAIQWLNEHWYLYILAALIVVLTIASIVLFFILRQDESQTKRVAPSKAPGLVPKVAPPKSEYGSTEKLMKEIRARQRLEAQYGKLPQRREESYSQLPRPSGDDFSVEGYDQVPPLGDQEEIIYEKLPPMPTSSDLATGLDAKQYYQRKSDQLKHLIALGSQKKKQQGRL